MLALPVDVHQKRSQAAKHARRYGAAVDLQRALAVRREPTGKDERLVRLHVQFLKQRRNAGIGTGKFGAHGAKGLARADQAPVRLSAEHKVDRVQNDRFSRARLARQHIDAGRKFQLSALDKCNILYEQLL